MKIGNAGANLVFFCKVGDSLQEGNEIMASFFDLLQEILAQLQRFCATITLLYEEVRRITKGDFLICIKDFSRRGGGVDLRSSSVATDFVFLLLARAEPKLTWSLPLMRSSVRDS